MLFPHMAAAMLAFANRHHLANSVSQFHNATKCFTPALIRRDISQPSVPQSLNDQINLLHRMQHHGRETHPALTINFKRLTALIVVPVTQPAIPQCLGKDGIIIPRRAHKVMDSRLAPYTRPRAATCAIAPAIEDGCKVVRWPAPVQVFAVRRIDNFEAMVESTRSRPHLREHSVSV